MTYQVVMPQLGMTMTEGSVVRWLKEPGERVSKGEPLFEVATDKVEMEVEAPCSGVIGEILVPADQVVPVGSPIAILTDTDVTSAGAAAASSASVPPVAPPAPPPATPPVAPPVVPASDARRAAPQMPATATGDTARAETERRISPRARRAADEAGVTAASLLAFKPRGRIVEADVRSFLARRLEQGHEAERMLAAYGASVQPRSAAASSGANVRQAVARRMEQSARDVPHFYLSSLVDATELTALRTALLPAVEAQAGVRLSFLDLFIRASALALRQHPDVNASWNGGAVVRHADVHVAFAAQFGDRLMTPVMRDAASQGVAALARQRAAFVEKGHAGTLSMRDVEDATFTISNLGPHGVDQFQAIVVPPQSAILAVGRIAARPIAVDRRLEVRDSVWLTLSVDHRTLDGAAAASFLSTLVSLLTSPYRLLLSDR